MENTQKDILPGLEKYKSLIRYVIVGVINTGVDFLVFTLLNSFFSAHYAVSQTAGYGAGVLNSFLMNKFWTFEDKKVNRKTYSQAVKFTVINLLSLGISIYGLKLLTGNVGLNMYVAKGCVTFITFAVNYIGYKLWVFDGKRS